MEQLHLFVRQAFPQQLCNLLCFFDRVYDHPCTAALCQLPAQQRGQLRLCERGQLHRLTGCIRWDGRLLYLCAVRPCQQRIAAAGFPRSVRGGLFLPVGLDQFRAPPGGQGGRQQNDRHLVPAQPFQCPVQIAVHVGIVGVALINNDHLARKPQMPQHNVLLGKCRQQQLIHCANHEVCQQCLLVSPKPLVYLHLMLFLRIFLQLHPAPL